MNYNKDNGLLNMIRRTDPMIIVPVILYYMFLLSICSCSLITKKESHDNEFHLKMEVFYKVLDIKNMLSKKEGIYLIYKVKSSNDDKGFQNASKVFLLFENHTGELVLKSISKKEKQNVTQYVLPCTYLGYDSDNKEFHFVPLFSPVEIDKDDYKKWDYQKGKTYIVDIYLKASSKNVLCYSNMVLSGHLNKEPIRIK